MKKTLLSVLIGLSAIAGSVKAEDLLTAYQHAKANDPVVLRAEAQVNAAKEDIIQARALLLPKLDLSGGFAKRDTDDTRPSIFAPSGSKTNTDVESTSYQVDLSMDLYRHSSWLRMGTAKKAAHQRDVAYQAAKQDLILRTTEAYFNVLGRLDDLEFAKAEKEAIARQLEQTKQRFSVGLTAITDVHEAQAQFDNALTDEIRAQNNVYAAQEALRVITNVYPRELKILNTAKFSASRPLPDSANEWQRTAEEQNLDLIAQKIGLDIAKENIGIEKAARLPTVSLSGRYSSADSDVTITGEQDVFFNSKEDTSSIGVQVSVPIYNGNIISSNVRRAQSNYVSASQDLESTHRTVVQNTRNAYNTVIASVSAIKALEQSVVSAESALKATEAGFEVGTRTIVDVLNSTRNLYNAKRNLSNTRYGYITSVLRLKRAGGTITEKDVADINASLVAAKR